jgi:tetratricopeptide (TPR) repeat protein
MRSSIASGRSPFPARAGLIGALCWLALAVPAAAQTLPPPQLDQPRILDRSDPRLAATVVEQIQRLIREGSYEAALAEAARAGDAHPRRVEIAFLTGVAQSRLGREDEAIATFEALTRDYPELAEPYNNLAVLYAARDELDRARATLEQAIRVQPSYALAHENLGDVLLRLARREYDLAARSATTTESATRKLGLVDDLIQRIGPDAGGPPPTGR